MDIKTMFKMNDRTFDILKWVAIIVLPAFIAFFKTVGVSVGFEYTAVISEVLHALHLFLGTILGISSLQYKDDKIDKLS